MHPSPDFTPADRVGQIKEYYFSRKLKELARLNAEGADIISLGIGLSLIHISEPTRH